MSRESTTKRQQQPVERSAMPCHATRHLSPRADGRVVGNGVRLHPRVDHLEEQVQGLAPLATLLASRDRRAVANHVRLRRATRYNRM